MTKIIFAISFYLSCLAAFSMESDSDAEFGSDSEKKSLIKHQKSPEQAFIEAVRKAAQNKGNDKKLQMLELEAMMPKISVNCFCKKMRVTPLYLACFYGDSDMVSLLIRSGANVNQCANIRVMGIDEEYHTKPRSPMGIALEKGHEKIIILLKLVGAVPVSSDENEVRMYNEMLNPSSEKCQIM